jgi:hypothetical protein
MESEGHDNQNLCLVLCPCENKKKVEEARPFVHSLQSSVFCEYSLKHLRNVIKASLFYSYFYYLHF